MKKVGFTIEFGKKDEEKDRGKNFAEGVKALARIADQRFSDATRAIGLEFSAYTDAIVEISNHTDDGDYETAIELMYFLALILDRDIKDTIENIIYPDEVATEIFLDYFSEYITAGYVIEDIIGEEGSEEENELQEDSIDDEYCCLKAMFDDEENGNEAE